MSLMIFQGISSIAWKRKSKSKGIYIALSNQYQCKLASEPDDNVYGKKRNECINPLRYLNAAFFSRQQFQYLRYRTAVSVSGHCFFCASTDTQPVSFVAVMLQKERKKERAKVKAQGKKEIQERVLQRCTAEELCGNGNTTGQSKT